jgi:hypothetical protein
MDSQQIELLGTAAFEAELIRRGFEVATPRRDRGIDLIIYTDQPSEPFRAVPLQLKISSGAAFNLDRKYERFTGLVLVYVWHIHTQPRYFCLTYQEALGVIGAQALQTPSWRDKGTYAMFKVSQARQQHLAPYEHRWEWLRAHLAGSVMPSVSD